MYEPDTENSGVTALASLVVLKVGLKGECPGPPGRSQGKIKRCEWPSLPGRPKGRPKV